jgi:hypothetical protein
MNLRVSSNKIHFQSENLQVDYITLNIENLVEWKDISKISSYLFNSLKFNSDLKDDQL